MDSQSQDDSLGVVSPGDIPKSQVVSTGHSMETGKAGAIGLSQDQKGVVIPGDIPNSQVVSTESCLIRNNDLSTKGMRTRLIGKYRL